MAVKSPANVQVTTSTTGFGPYQLTNTVPASTGYRSIADAVADGSLVNGDTVHYGIEQNAAPTGKMFERGIGTINTSTLVLTVTFVIERSAALTSGGGWGSGVKDVFFGPPGAESVALLSQQNVFTDIQFLRGTYLESQLSPGTVEWLRFQRIAQQGYLAMSSDKTAKEPLKIQNGWQGTGTAGGETSIDFEVGDYAGLIRALRIKESGALEAIGAVSVGGALAVTGALSVVGAGSIGGALTGVTSVTDSTSRKAVFLAGGNVNKVPWYQAAAPTGWVKDTSQNDKAMRVVSGTGGGTGGSRALSSSVVGGTALSISHLPSHEHEVEVTAWPVSSDEGGEHQLIEYTGVGTMTTSSVGGGATHDHALELAYIDLIIASLT